MKITIDGLEQNGEMLYLNTKDIRGQVKELKSTVKVNGESIEYGVKFYDRINEETTCDVVGKVTMTINDQEISNEYEIAPKMLMKGIYNSIINVVQMHKTDEIKNLMHSIVIRAIDSVCENAIIEGASYDGISFIKNDDRIIGSCYGVTINSNNSVTMRDLDMIEAINDEFRLEIYKENAFISIDLKVEDGNYKLKNVEVINEVPYENLKNSDDFETYDEFIVYRRGFSLLKEDEVKSEDNFLNDFF